MRIFLTARGDGENAKETEDEASVMSVSGDSPIGKDQN